MSSSPRPLLEYYDVCLYDEDMDNLQGLGWLSDNNLSFWYEYLEREVIPNFTDTSVLLIRPSLAFLIAQTPDPSMIADALPPNLMDASHLFLPINDNTDTTSVGGSHWSLLIVSLRDNVSMSYDSLHNANEEPARHMSSAFSKLFNSKRAGAGSGGAGAGQEFEFVSMQTPQQENGSDCGVSVCLLTRLLVGRL
ncbi:cysteine proteinase, partial [Saitoella complicata NRRL Y-17804]